MRHWPALVLACGAVACALVLAHEKREAEGRLYLFREDPVTGELSVVDAPVLWPWFLAAVVLAAAAAITLAVRGRGTALPRGGARRRD